MAKRRSDRTVFTPRVITSDLAVAGEKLTYWKQVLPEAPIQYTDQSGKTRTINFDSGYHADLIQSFRDKAIDQTCFQLANPNNSHGRDFDPERQRAEVLDLVRYEDLPDTVRAEVGNNPGLYAKMRFFNKRAARAVAENPNLGVSARVRENFTRADGKFVKRALIHVLGTIDPRVTGMSAWAAADLSYDPDHGYVLDLSEAEYEGNAMSGKNKNKGTATVPSEDEIDAMTDAELDEFLAESAASLGLEYQAGVDDPDEDDEDENEDDDAEDGDDEEDHEEPVGASLSNVDLANAQAAQANARALTALKRQAEAEFRGYRSEQVGVAGVPPWVLDLAEPVLNRPDDMVVDLSNTDDDDVNVTEIVRKLVEGYKGTVDLSVEAGHGGTVDLGNENDPDEAELEAWEAQFPSS